MVDHYQFLKAPSVINILLNVINIILDARFLDYWMCCTSYCNPKVKTSATRAIMTSILQTL
eukprot:3847443-Amphidinium_carterae.2